MPHLAARKVTSAIAPFVGLLAVVIVFFIIPPHHALTLDHVRTIAVHTVLVGVVALGATLVIASGGLDLSVGSVLALCSVIIAIALRSGWPLAAGITAAIAVGGACGLYNGLLITILRLPPFIATLGTLGFFRGVAKWISGSRTISAPTHGMEQITMPTPAAKWMLMAPAVWIMLALAGCMAFLLHRTVLGRHALAVGSSEATARLCGVRVGLTRVYVYVIAGVLVGLAGVLQFAALAVGRSDRRGGIGTGCHRCGGDRRRFAFRRTRFGCRHARRRGDDGVPAESLRGPRLAQLGAGDHRRPHHHPCSRARSMARAENAVRRAAIDDSGLPIVD